MTDGTTLQTEPVRKFQKVCDILNRHDYSPARMVAILQEIQEEYRYLPEKVLHYVANALGIPSARVFGVATFYSQFTLEPRGKYLMQVCDGTACHVKGAMDIYDAMVKQLEMPEGHETTPDMMFTVETVSCVGACGLAPVLTVNGAVHGNLTPRAAVELIEKIKLQEADKDE